MQLFSFYYLQNWKLIITFLTPQYDSLTNHTPFWLASQIDGSIVWDPAGISGYDPATKQVPVALCLPNSSTENNCVDTQIFYIVIIAGLVLSNCILSFCTIHRRWKIAFLYFIFVQQRTSFFHLFFVEPFKSKSFYRSWE